MPHVEVSAGTVLAVLGLVLLIVQPGAIPFTYAVATRYTRRGGKRPALTAVGAYLLGFVFTLIVVAVFACSDFPLFAALLFGWGTIWLFAILILRDPEVRPSGAHLRS
ncbi:hypothetical protein [Actinoplanes regularis]|uniref:hypothetical protein n=1 Tax=Actinoplanes regularis TaxID=52697 RepID=UPI0025578A38|nr:hypothetical protein [Actinoplanes regularis]GLW31595.1 hypothetical protein Areg01_45350 [Actinoplanes regularis]